MNKSDSERISAGLEKKGYEKASKISGADLIVINMCSVRQPAVDRIFGQHKNLAELKAKNKNLKTVLTGCVLKKDKLKLRNIFDEIWEAGKYPRAAESAESKNLSYIPVSNGCNNACAYCVVPFTRGRLVCRSHKDILKEIKNAAKKGSADIWLLGQNVNDYKSPIDPTVNFAKLLKKINDIPNEFQLSFTSPHPNNFSEELINSLQKCDKFSGLLNLPVQSGDDEILRKMNRNYTAKQYLGLAKKLKRKIPQIKLSTDIIVGFPGETNKQFQNTVKLFKKIKFGAAFISKYSPRPGTVAAKMEDNVPWTEKKKRERILRALLPAREVIPSRSLLGITSRAEHQKKMDKKIVVIVGPTASGKSDLAVKIAGKFNGEIISADSRQVYKGMDIGSGKITKKEMRGIPHHLLDVASPRIKFSVVRYRKLALAAIDKIFKNKNLPIICGGTGFYIQAIVDGITIPAVRPDWKLRKSLEKKSAEKLYQKLKKLDPKRAGTIDEKNKRRLIRALEIVLKTKKPVPALKTAPLPYPVLFLGIKKSKKDLEKMIAKRLFKRLGEGMVNEVRKLKKTGLSWKRLEEFGLEYRWIARFLQKKISYREMLVSLQKETEHYAKRQITWLKRNKRIQWIDNFRDAESIIKKFI